MAVLVTCKNVEDPIKNKGTCSQDFPIITLWKFSFAMETRSASLSQRYSCLKVWMHTGMD